MLRSDTLNGSGTWVFGDEAHAGEAAARHGHGVFHGGERVLQLVPGPRLRQATLPLLTRAHRKYEEHEAVHVNRVRQSAVRVHWKRQC